MADFAKFITMVGIGQVSGDDNAYSNNYVSCDHSVCHMIIWHIV